LKLRLLQMYNPSSTIREKYPKYASILQAPSHLMEFTGGGQIQTIEMPYLSRNRLMPTQKNYETTALLHGEYYIFVAQPLANSAGSPEDIFFNVYMELCDDFVYYGYATEFIQSNSVFFFPVPEEEAESPIIDSIAIDEGKDPFMENLINFEAQSLEVMNAPQEQTDKTHHMQVSEDSRLQPILDMRSLIRRLYPSVIYPISLAADSAEDFVLPCLNEIGEQSGYSTFLPACISRMYYGKHVGIKYRFTIVATSETELRHVQAKFYFSPAAVTAAAPVVPFPSLYAAPPVASTLYNILSPSQFPLNNVQLPSVLPHVQVYEFTIPNTNMFKFVGGPTKMLNIADANIPYAVSSIGDVVVSISSSVEFKGLLRIEAAFTDETRLGFHCLAPRVIYSSPNRSVPGLYTAPNLPVLPAATDPSIPFLYYTRL